VSADLRRYFRHWFAQAEIDDLVQSTLTAVSAKLHKFEDRGDNAFIRWVYGFARTEARAGLRRRRRNDDRLDALARRITPPHMNPSSQIDREQRLEMIWQAAKQLPDAQRRAIENDLAGGDAGTLAEQEKVGRGSARMIQSRARRKLRVLVHEHMVKRPATRSPSTPAG
jgi:RNA polymerase sigma factor (sigma-70 family)